MICIVFFFIIYLLEGEIYRNWGEKSFWREVLFDIVRDWNGVKKWFHAIHLFLSVNDNMKPFLCKIMSALLFM